MRIHPCALAVVSLLSACEPGPRRSLAVAEHAPAAGTVGPGGCFVVSYGAARRRSAPPAGNAASSADSAPARASVENTFRVARDPNPGQYPFTYRLSSIDTTRLYLRGTWRSVRADSAEFVFMHRPGTVAVRREEGQWAGHWTGVVHDPRDFTPHREVRDVRLRPVSCEAPARG